MSKCNIDGCDEEALYMDSFGNEYCEDCMHIEIQEDEDLSYKDFQDIC